MGPRLADHFHRAATAHLSASAAVRARIHTQGVLGVFKTITGETRYSTKPIYEQLANHPDTPAQLRPLFQFIAHGSGELQAILSAASTVQALTPGIGQLLANDLAPPIQSLIADNPGSLIDPATAARMVNQGIWSAGHAMKEAARGGIDNPRMESLIASLAGHLDAASALELLRRGEITQEQFHGELRQQGFPDITVRAIHQLVRQHIPAELAADMVLRGVLTEQSGRAIAATWGVTAGDFDAMVLNTGEPPAVDELLFLYRRGQITKARLEHGIRQSRVRNEWIGEVEALRYRPMDTGSAVAAVVQGHLSDHAGQQIAEQNGLEPTHWRPLVETHGRPPGAQELLQLLNRGAISQSEVEQAIRESDIKNKYIPALLKIRRHLMPERTVVSAISKGVFTEREGIDHLLNLGFNAADAKALASEASATKTAHHKTLAEGTILRLYAGHTITRDQAHKSIVALGYTAQETDWLLAFEDLRRVEAERAHLLTALRAQFIAHHIDANAVLADGSAAGIAHAELEHLLTIWTLERKANARHLTEAQVVHLHKKGLLDTPTAQAKLVAMGYADADASLLIQGYG